MDRDFRHVLVIGGTGMLRGACVALAAEAGALTVIARTSRSLARLGEALASSRAGSPAGRPVTYRPVALDYVRTEALRTAVRPAIDAHGPVDLVVAWIHATAPEAPLAVAQEVAATADGSLFVHVLGSAAGDPSASLDPVAAPFLGIERLDYCAVVRGFESGGGRARWLTDEEISAGVLAAIRSARASGASRAGSEAPRVHVVGSIRPWSARP